MEEKKKKAPKVIYQGAITPQFISGSIAKHSTKKDIGAHTIFLGQARNDVINGKEVTAIEYSAYEEMAEEQFYLIREEAFAKYELSCMHIYHSLGTVKTGEISLFVFVSSKNRKHVFEACSFIVEAIKSSVPVWGKELFEDGSHVWKTNNLI